MYEVLSLIANRSNIVLTFLFRTRIQMILCSIITQHSCFRVSIDVHNQKKITLSK